jgi:hypothetical protein
VGDALGLDGKGCVVNGIRDIAVLPAMTDGKVSQGHRRSFFSHNNYWALDKGTETTTPRVPHHIAELRRALRLLE